MRLRARVGIGEANGRTWVWGDVGRGRDSPVGWGLIGGLEGASEGTSASEDW